MLDYARSGWQQFWQEDQTFWSVWVEWYRISTSCAHPQDRKLELDNYAMNVLQILKESPAGNKVKCVTSMLLYAEIIEAVQVVTRVENDQIVHRFTDDPRGIKFCVGSFLSHWKKFVVIDVAKLILLLVKLEERRAAMSRSESVPADLSLGIQKPLRELLTTAGTVPEDFKWDNCLEMGARWEVRLERGTRTLALELDAIGAAVEQDGVETAMDTLAYVTEDRHLDIGDESWLSFFDMDELDASFGVEGVSNDSANLGAVGLVQQCHDARDTARARMPMSGGAQ